MLCVVLWGIEVVVSLHRWWECFLFIYLFFLGRGGGVVEEMRRGGGRSRGKGKGESRRGGLRL